MVRAVEGLVSAVASVLGLLLVGSSPPGLVSHPVIAEVASIDDPDAPDNDFQSADAPLADVELPDAYREPDPCESEPGLPAVLFLDNHRPPITLTMQSVNSSFAISLAFIFGFFLLE